ncbi:MAG: thiamine-phosphate kinase [Candidatus Hadarchaeales archaeon]
MDLASVGERKVVQLARQIFKRRRWVELGIGDDSAVVKLKGKKIVLTTDMFVEGVHFLPGTAPEHLAKKTVVATLSDLAAMGAKPLALLFSVALPRSTSFSFVRRMMQEMNRVALENSAPVVGGDVDESGKIVIAGVGVGEAGKHIITRSGARPGDFVAVTGTLGRAAAGLKILKENLPRQKFLMLVKAHLEPESRVKEGMVLGSDAGVTAAIDVSDGLARNLHQLAEESGVKIVVEKEKIPVDPLVVEFSKEAMVPPEEFALYGGEDFELIFTFRRGAAALRALEKFGTKVSVIGRVEAGRGVFLARGRKLRRLKPRGFEHFVA